MSGFLGLFGKKETPEVERFTLQSLKTLHQGLIDNVVITSDNAQHVIEILRQISETVVYGDKKSEILFDYFCEKNMLQLFLRLLRENKRPISTPSSSNNFDVTNSSKQRSQATSSRSMINSVHVQILQTLSILCQCVRHSTSLYYLLSNNYINECLLHDFDFEQSQDEVCCLNVTI
jgi:protein CLEC16A